MVVVLSLLSGLKILPCRPHVAFRWGSIELKVWEYRTGQEEEKSTDTLL